MKAKIAPPVPINAPIREIMKNMPRLSKIKPFRCPRFNEMGLGG